MFIQAMIKYLRSSKFLKSLLKGEFKVHSQYRFPITNFWKLTYDITELRRLEIVYIKKYPCFNTF